MEFSFIIDFILHVDKYISLLINQFGIFAYLILFLVIFCETGLVVTPFLPGDSLIFIAGAFSANGDFNVLALFFLLSFAAIAGDSLNYFIGSYFGERVFYNSRFFKKEYLEKTKEFFRKHGGKTIVLARYIPIIRTFAPFVAGIGKMDYPRFLGFNVAGGIFWVGLFLFSGYFLGSIPFVEKNLALLTYLIILISILPAIIGFIHSKLKSKS